MKGIILAGGVGTRLKPLTTALSKQMLPIYDKPMIYYPISILMLAGIREILIISTSEHIALYEMQLKDGSQLGISFEYAIQDKPRGLADAFIVGEKFIDDEDVALILGDNIFYGSYITEMLIDAIQLITENRGAIVFGYYVKDPRPFGVIEFNKLGEIVSIEEKPKNPKSNYIVPGLYFYDNNVVKLVNQIKPSNRGEIEITSLNNLYLINDKLTALKFGRGIAWFDAGTSSGLLEASNFVEAIQNRQGFYIAALEEIAFRKSFITRNQYMQLANDLIQSEYGQYLFDIIDEIDKTN